MIFLTLKTKAAGGKSMTVPHERFRSARGDEWSEKWCDRAAAHCRHLQFAQDLNQPPYSRHVLRGWGRTRAKESIQSMAST